MKTHRKNLLVAIHFFGVVLGWVSLANCQMKLEVGEKVKVATFFGWEDGEVLGKQGKGWGVKYKRKRLNLEETDLFHRNQIRKLCEADALGWARNWANATGSFKVDAALKSFTDTTVTLTKLDLKEVTVKIELLSIKDVAYLNKLKKNYEEGAKRGEIPAIIPPLPEVTEFEEDSTEAIGVGIGDAGELTRLGTMPSFLGTFQQEGVGFPKIRYNQEPVAIIPVGGPDQLVLVTARERRWLRDAHFQAQGYWVSLKQKKVINTFAVSSDAYPVDYDPRHKLLLTVRRSDGVFSAKVPVPKGLSEAEAYTDLGEYVLWRLKPGDSKVEPILRWHAGADAFPDAPMAKIIDAKTVLMKIGRHAFRALDLETKRVKYSFKTSSFRPNIGLELTDDRKHLIVPDGERIHVISADNGESKFSVQVPQDWAFGANVSPSGTKLAAITGSSFYVWDLSSSESSPAPTVYPAPMIGSPFFGRLQWVDEDNILVNGFTKQVLYRLSLKLPVWSYETDFGETMVHSHDPLISRVVNGFVFYMADRRSVFGSMMAVGAVKLPGPSVENLAEMATGEDADSFYVLRPGINVGISVGSVTDPEQVKEWLVEKIEEAGWVYDQSSEIQIHAEMGVAPSREETYRRFGDFRGDSITTVTVTPHFASIKIKDESRVLWQTGVSTSAPMFMRTDDLQKTIKDAEVPQLDFFNRVKFEPRVLDPEYSYGFGVSKLGLKGIEVVTTSPPGRVDDPFAEAEKMREERGNMKPPAEPDPTPGGQANPNGNQPGFTPPGFPPPGSQTEGTPKGGQ